MGHHFLEQLFGYPSWTDQQFNNFNNAWEKMSDPKLKFNWSQFFPPPTSVPDWFKTVAKAGIPAGLGALQKKQVAGNVFVLHNNLVNVLKDPDMNGNLAQALDTEKTLLLPQMKVPLSRGPMTKFSSRT